MRKTVGKHESETAPRFGVRMTGKRLMQQSRQGGLEEGLGICLGLCGNFLDVLFMVNILTLRAENKKSKAVRLSTGIFL